MKLTRRQLSRDWENLMDRGRCQAPLPGLISCLALCASLLVGCAAKPGGPLGVTLGRDDACGFEPFAPYAPVRVVYGPQGLPMIVVGLQVRDAAPGDPIDVSIQVVAEGATAAQAKTGGQAMAAGMPLELPSVYVIVVRSADFTQLTASAQVSVRSQSGSTGSDERSLTLIGTATPRDNDAGLVDSGVDCEM
jgi:hypothetical protein